MAEENKILFKIEVDDNGVVTALKSTSQGYQDIDLTTKNARSSAEKLNQAIRNTGSGGTLKGIKVTNNEYKKLLKTQDQLKNKSGAASSAAMELGRVISDAPYGIRGMANNITQLVSQLGYATVAAGGFRLALKQMWTALMGPLGIVLAITTVVSAFDFFAGGQKKSKEETKEHNEELEKQAGLMRDLNSILEVLSVSSDAVSLDWMDGFVAGVDKLNTKDLLKILERDIKGITNAFEKLPKEEQNIQGIEILVEKRKKLLESIAIEKELKKELNELEKEFAVYRFLPESQKKTQLSNEIVEKQKELLATQKAIIDIEDLFKKNKEGKKELRDKASVLIDLKPIDPSKLAKKAQKIIDTFKKYTSLEVDENPLDISDFIPEELSEETKNKIRDYNKLLTKMMGDKFNAEDTAEKLDKFKEGLNAINGFIDAQFERELTTEQNKTTALNEELNNRLLNENLSKDKRIKIQNEIAQNDERLRVKQNAIKKKQFNTQKAFNLSMALVDTASSTLKAYGSQLIPGDPTSIIRAKVAAGIAAAMGLAQVATIASQKFQPSSASTPIRTSSGGGASGGVGDRSFDFNLVGATQGNQVLDAIQGQFNKPVQAYVVSRDMTSQQQLDANIKNQASF
jgi:hypothetical protein